MAPSWYSYSPSPLEEQSGITRRDGPALAGVQFHISLTVERNWSRKIEVVVLLSTSYISIELKQCQMLFLFTFTICQHTSLISFLLRLDTSHFFFFLTQHMQFVDWIYAVCGFLQHTKSISQFCWGIRLHCFLMKAQNFPDISKI